VSEALLYPRPSEDGGLLAQLVEQLTLNQRVAGSNPAQPTNNFNDLDTASSWALSFVDTQWTHATDPTRNNGRVSVAVSSYLCRHHWDVLAAASAH
jgi:hypothetical protein